jgi:hypothetical protein
MQSQVPEVSANQPDRAVKDRERVGLGRQRSRRPILGEPVHAFNIGDRHPSRAAMSPSSTRTA